MRPRVRPARAACRNEFNLQLAKRIEIGLVNGGFARTTLITARGVVSTVACSASASLYEDCVALGHPDLTAIVIYKATGYPPFFNEGEARSKHFNPNNLKQVERWQNEVARVFEWCKKEK